jgi:hypothetical protein
MHQKRILVRIKVMTNVIEPLSFEVLSQLAPPQIPIGLEDRIIVRIQRARLRGLYARLAFSLVGCVAGCAYLALAGRDLLIAVRQSAAFDVARLAFSDPDIIFMNLQDALLGLAESLPFGAIAFAASAVFSAVCAIEFGLALRRQKRPQAGTVVA